MFGNLDDPKQQMLLAMGLGLLGNQSGNIGQDIGRAGLLGLNAYNTGQSRKAKLAEEEQQRQLRAMQMAQLKKEQEDQAYAQQIAPQFFQPGSPGVDQAGNEMGVPPTAPKHDLAGYGMALAPRSLKMAMPFIQAGMKDETPLVGKPGDVFLDRKTYKPMAAIPQAPKDWQDPAYQEWALRRARAGATSVNVDTGKQEDAFNKEYGKNLAETYSNLMKGDLSASSKMNNLARLQSLLKSSGNTNKLTPLTLELKQVADALGMKGVITGKEDFQVAAKALSNQMALELRNPAGGAGMPGALSDKDREFLVGMTAGIDKMPNANAMIIETQRRIAARDKEVAKMAREYRARHGKFDEGFYRELAQYSEANPLFADLTGPSGEATDTQQLVDEARRRGLIK